VKAPDDRDAVGAFVLFCSFTLAAFFSVVMIVEWLRPLATVAVEHACR